MMRNACTLLFALFLTSTIAQDAVTGKIENYTQGAATIITGFGGPMEIGQLQEDGSFKIPLTTDHKTKIIASVETENQGESQWKTSIPTLKRSYGECNGKIAFEGGEQTMIELGTGGMLSVANMKEQKLIGSILFASSESFAKAYMAIGQFKMETGYQIGWYYFEEPASVSGQCQMETYTRSMEQKYIHSTGYDLQFKPGWNIVKYEVEEVFVDAEGKKYPMKERFTSLENIPEDVQIHLLENTWR